MIKLGIVGLGGMGKHHMLALDRVRGCRVTAGADTAAAARKEFAQKHPGVALYTDHKA